MTLVERSQNQTLLRTAQCGFLLLLITPLDVVGWGLVSEYMDVIHPKLLQMVWLAALLVPILGCLLLVAYKNPGIYRFGRGLVLVLAPMFPLAAANLGWSIYSAPPNVYTLAEPLAGRPDNRVVWLVFDELDQYVAFENRPESIEMPAFDRLRRESVFALDAYPPCSQTQESLPSLLTGVLTQKADWDGDKLMLESAASEALEFADTPTIFSRARERGLNGGLVGWWLPFCNVIGHSTTSCATPSLAATMEPTIARSMYRELQTYTGQHWIVNRFGGDSQYHADWWGFRDRRVQLLFYEFIHRQTLRMAADPALGVVFAHYPVPHPLGIFDRYTNQTGLEFRYNYIDNFELADQALQEVREALESAGLGDSTTLLVSSDHPFRPETWSKREVWTEEEAQISEGREFTRIPFLLKLRGHESGVVYEPPFNTILSADLLLDILSGSVQSPEEIVAWLDEKRETVRVEALHTSD
jgi:hypothetical protein